MTTAALNADRSDHDATAADAVTDELLNVLVRDHDVTSRPTFERLWDYYRNELDFGQSDAHRPYATAQEQGLPHRLTRRPGEAVGMMDVGGGRREVVIENDIAWRIHTLVDFMFGKGVTGSAVGVGTRPFQTTRAPAHRSAPSHRQSERSAHHLDQTGSAEHARGGWI